MAQYNAAVICVFATRLGAEASYILMKYIGVGVLLGLIAGVVVMGSTESAAGFVLAPILGVGFFVWARD